jgi:hypothetical protein
VKRAFCDKIFAPKSALAEGICQDGEFARARIEHVEERLSHELGCEVGIQV